jgi:mono/diheme cytochrome c family protein
MVAAVLGALAVAGAIFAVAFFQRDEPETHADIEEHFKYGSIGAEAEGGMPYWIWRVLPDVFADLLPEGDGEGYERMGFIFESEETIRPIGTSLRRMPVDLIGLNCAACHTATVRDSPEAPPRVVLGTSAQKFDIQAYFNFLFAVARDERFDADILIPAIREVNPDFSRIEELLYRLVVIPQTKERLVERADELALLEERPPIGPGRVDTFFSYKVHFGIRQDVNDPVGTVDFPAIWNQRLRTGMWLHWDGTNDSVEERNLTAALGAGATEESIDHESLQRVTDWISDLKPPEMPRDRIDWSRVPPGRRIFDARCASCHSFGGEDVGDVTPIEDVKTDPNRWQSFTPELAAKLNTFGEGYPWRFSRFRKSDGYANMPLDGIWLRAPYLHNGSVPMLRDLLRPPDERPDVFYRGYDVYDYENVGFVSDGEAASAGFRYDTSVRGNANEGHNYGTDLSEQQVEDLLQFLKTQ